MKRELFGGDEARYREMLHADGMDEIAPGTPFESILRKAVASGRIQGADAPLL